MRVRSSLRSDCRSKSARTFAILSDWLCSPTWLTISVSASAIWALVARGSSACAAPATSPRASAQRASADACLRSAGASRRLRRASSTKNAPRSNSVTASAASAAISTGTRNDVRDLKDQLLDASRSHHATRSLTRRRSRSAPIVMNPTATTSAAPICDGSEASPDVPFCGFGLPAGAPLERAPCDRLARAGQQHALHHDLARAGVRIRRELRVGLGPLRALRTRLRRLRRRVAAVRAGVGPAPAAAAAGSRAARAGAAEARSRRRRPRACPRSPPRSDPVTVTLTRSVPSQTDAHAGDEPPVPRTTTRGSRLPDTL